MQQNVARYGTVGTTKNIFYVFKMVVSKLQGIIDIISVVTMANCHDSPLRHIYTMTVMHIGSKLIHILCIHTECAITAIHSECALSKFTPIGGGLKANCIIT